MKRLYATLVVLSAAGHALADAIGNPLDNNGDGGGTISIPILLIGGALFWWLSKK